MKRFAFKFAIFLIPIVVMLIGAEYRLTRVRNSYTTKLALMHNSATAEVLVLGSSHAYDGINPDCFSRPGFNMANMSQLFYHDSQILDRFGVFLPNLKFVIFSISYFSFEANPGIVPEKWRAFFYRQYYGIPANRWLLRWDVRNYSKLALYSYESVKHLKSLPTDLSGSISSTGWQRVPATETTGQTPISDRTGKARVQFHRALMREDYRPESVQSLRDSIDWCLCRGITPILLTPPVYHTYTDHIDRAKYRWMQACICELCSAYQLSYWNYFTDPRFNLKDFADDDHLNETGAEELSRMIDEEVFRTDFRKPTPTTIRYQPHLSKQDNQSDG